MNLADYLLANDMAEERRREAAQHALAKRLRASRNDHDRTSFRRLTARGFAAISRSSAAAVRRLDGGIADDLTARLVTGPRA